jgi:hypothetical protein
VIAEPGTTLTDFLLAACAAVWGARLWADAERRGARAARWWAAGFFATAAAATLGGVAHGFPGVLGARAAEAVWLATLHAIGVFAFCALATAATAALRPPARTAAVALAAAALAAYVAWVIEAPEFDRAIVAYGAAMAVLAIQQAGDRFRRRSRSAPWILAGIAVAAAGSWVQRSGLGLHPRWFDHNAVYHVIEIGAAWLLYRGGLRLEDRA